jgi:hypothetical protein
MTGTTADSLQTPDGAPTQELRERVTLVGFVVTAIVATVVWLVLLGWIAVAGLRALGV